MGGGSGDGVLEIGYEAAKAPLATSFSYAFIERI
jgi:hypothetical protein